MIDIDRVKQKDEEEMQEVYEVVKQKEYMILKTELIMQQKSIYSENYKPLFINEMNENKIKEFSNILSQKLRHVKLAISKANLGQNKYVSIDADYDKKKEELETKRKMKSYKTNKKGLSQDKQSMTTIEDKLKVAPVKKIYFRSLRNPNKIEYPNETELMEVNHKKNKGKEPYNFFYAKPYLKPIIKSKIKEIYLLNSHKNLTQEEEFERYRHDFEQGMNDLNMFVKKNFK